MALDDRLATLLSNHDAVTREYHLCRSGKVALTTALAEWQHSAWQWYCAALQRQQTAAPGCPHDPKPR